MKGRDKGNSDCHIPNDAYREGWDRIFGRKEPVVGINPKDAAKAEIDLIVRSEQAMIDTGWTIDSFGPSSRTVERAEKAMIDLFYEPGIDDSFYLTGE